MEIYKNSVYEFENFISDSQQEELLNIVNSRTEEDWKQDFQGLWWFGNAISVRDSSAVKDILNKVRSLFDESWTVEENLSIFRFTPDSKTIGHHTDNGYNKLTRYGAIIYLNDDFVGGELMYPEINFRVKPKAKSLVMHNANLVHYVEPLGLGPSRYMLLTFISHDTKDSFGLS